MKIYFVFFFSIITLLGLTGCKNTSLKAPDVIVSVPPYVYLIDEISQHTLHVETVVPPGYDPHIFEISPQKMTSFMQAKVWIGIGELYETALGKAFEQHASLVKVDLSAKQSSHHHCEHTHNEHACDHQGMDRHFWMSPRIMSDQAKTITQALIQAFPDKKEIFTKGLSILLDQLATLDLELSHKLRPLEGKTLLVSHPAFGYFCEEYGLEQLSVECEGKSPLPTHISTLLQQMKENSLLCVIIQPQTDNKGAIAFAKQAHKPIFSIDPQDIDYMTNMHKLADSLVQAYTHDLAKEA